MKNKYFLLKNNVLEKIWSSISLGTNSYIAQ